MNLGIKNRVSNFFSKEDGEINMIAIIVLAIIVIVVAGIFRENLVDVVNAIFTKITGDLENAK